MSTHKSLFITIVSIRDEIRDEKGDLEGIPVMLVGNKCDEVARECDVTEGAELAKRWDCAFLETSAKTNHNVKELFQVYLVARKSSVPENRQIWPKQL